MTEEEIKAQEEAQAQEQVQEEKPKGRAAAILAFRTKYPERFPDETAPDPEDDEVYDDYMSEHAGLSERLGKLEEANNKYSEREMKFVALVDNNPDLQELLSAINEDDEFLESMKARKMRLAEKEKNAQETVKNILAWQQEDGLTDDERVQRVQWIIQLAENIDNDIITRDIWESAGKAINYDNDLSATAEAVALETRNEMIDKDKLKMKKDQQLFPDLNTASAAKPKPQRIVEEEPKPRSYYDQLEVVK